MAIFSEPRREELLVTLADLNPDAILYEPREAFDRAVVALARHPADRWGSSRSSSEWVVVYSYERAVCALAELEGTEDPDRIEAIAEHISFNSMGGWYGVNTPTWLDEIEEEGAGQLIFASSIQES